ncbi:hypothetical protein BCR36DRAFT_352950 [Piromyces finnis]|uniref:K Homology domain-containing protein n=1 Tax=Piromyces finnis TaxID=1754191 RepID=A0A1Y1VAU8_9FUNG|nr:hypothetical protein BCR36DRAFT_352950 [Piromyces finnis]|eukprot:ORX50040.1 hypothetical protein BCR36DRAFT_352950 [Piromyces finnis]
MSNNVKLVKLGSRQFRVPLSSFTKTIYTNKGSSEHITPDKNDTDLLVLRVPCEMEYRGSIIGKKGATKKRIMRESGVKEIWIPDAETDEDIIIKGYDEEGLQHARDLIFKIIEDTQNKETNKATHFLSYPLMDPDFLSKIEDLYEDWMEMSKDKDFLSSILMPPKCMHLTIGTLCLRNEKEIQKAIELMRTLSSQVYDKFNTHSALLKIKGLSLMKGTIKNARVIYAEIQKEQSYQVVQEVCQFLLDKFREAGLIVREESKEILLHATLLNTIYYNNKLKNTYDATEIFERYGHINFGNVLLRNISLCKIGTKNAEKGYYSLEKISLP